MRRLPAFASLPPTAAVTGCWSPEHLSGDATELLPRLLGHLPDRLAHSRLAGRHAVGLTAAVAAPDRDLLVAAALLHDVGYAAALQQTGFHPLDGARFLLAAGAPYRLAALVAHHSEARLLATAAGLEQEMAVFEREESPVSDALACADMTAGPTGWPMSIDDRLADIERRHRAEDPALLAARLDRVPRLLAAADRVRRRLEEAGAAAVARYR
jgi:hypothetical protein